MVLIVEDERHLADSLKNPFEAVLFEAGLDLQKSIQPGICAKDRRRRMPVGNIQRYQKGRCSHSDSTGFLVHITGDIP